MFILLKNLFFSFKKSTFLFLSFFLVVTLSFTVIGTTNSFSSQLENNVYSFLNNNKSPNTTIFDKNDSDKKEEKKLFDAINDKLSFFSDFLKEQHSKYTFEFESFYYSLILGVNDKKISKQSVNFYSNVLFSETKKLNILYSKNNINLDNNSIFVSHYFAKNDYVSVNSTLNLNLSSSFFSQSTSTNVPFNVKNIGYSPIDILNQDSRTITFNPNNEKYFYTSEKWFSNHQDLTRNGMFILAKKNGEMINTYSDILNFQHLLFTYMQNNLPDEDLDLWKHCQFYNFNSWYLFKNNIVSGIVKINDYVGIILAIIIFLFSFFIFLIITKKFIEQRILDITTYKTIGYLPYQITAPFLIFPLIIFFSSSLVSIGLSIMAQSLLIKSQEKIFNIYTSCFHLNWSFLLPLFSIVFLFLLILTFFTVLIYIKKNINASFSQKENVKPTWFSSLVSFLTFFYPFRIRFFFAFSSKIIGKIIFSFFSALTCVILFMISISGASFFSYTYDSYNNDNNYKKLIINNTFWSMNSSLSPPDDVKKYSDFYNISPLVSSFKDTDITEINSNETAKEAVDKIFDPQDNFYFKVKFIGTDENIKKWKNYFCSLLKKDEELNNVCNQLLNNDNLKEININLASDDSIKDNYFLNGIILPRGDKSSLVIANKYFYDDSLEFNKNYARNLVKLNPIFFKDLNNYYDNFLKGKNDNNVLPVIIGSGFAKKNNLGVGSVFGENFFGDDDVTKSNINKKSEKKFFVYKIFDWTNFNYAFYYGGNFIFTSDYVINDYLKKCPLKKNLIFNTFSFSFNKNYFEPSNSNCITLIKESSTDVLHVYSLTNRKIEIKKNNVLYLIFYNFSIISDVLILISIISIILCILIVGMIIKFFIDENSYSISVLKAMGWVYKDIIIFFSKIIFPSILFGFLCGEFFGKFILEEISYFASNKTDEYIYLNSNIYILLISCAFTLLLYLIVLTINFLRLRKISVVVLLKK